nr:DUF6596 domain-containing protein [Fodinicola feengrottensis]
MALTLRCLGGLSTAEVARLFLVPEATVSQRIVRAKAKIRDAGIPYRLPAAEDLPARLPAVQAVIYLLFTEGHTATTGDRLIRAELCAEAIRLARILHHLLPAEPEVPALLALLLLTDARRAARTDRDGRLVTLPEQDRDLWDRAQVAEGRELLVGALRSGAAGPYGLQAAIAAVHADAPAAEATDWKQISGLYQLLATATASPMVHLNHAIAVGMADGPAVGLRLLADLDAAGRLPHSHLTAVARADFLSKVDRAAEAAVAYEEAIAQAENTVERDFLIDRRDALLRSAPEGKNP